MVTGEQRALTMEPSTNVDPLMALRECSARLGADASLIQAGGGNTSIKQGDVLWVKASGRWLAQALHEPMFVPVSLSGVCRRIAAHEADPVGPETLTLPDAAGLRPSIETTLHALLPHRVVLHVHSVDALAWLVRDDAQERITPLLRRLLWAWVPYVRPGVVLARVVARALAQSPVDVVVLGNHGLVVGADSAAEAEALLREVVRRLALPARGAPPADTATLQRLSAGSAYRLPDDPACHALATGAAQRARAAGGALYPDHVVFLGGGLPVVEPGEAWPTGAPAVLVAGAGVLVHESLDAAGQMMLRCLTDVLARVALPAKLRYLPEEEVGALSNWDAEKFRRQHGHS